MIDFFRLTKPVALDDTLVDTLALDQTLRMRLHDLEILRRRYISCPKCRKSVGYHIGVGILKCPHCGFNANLSGDNDKPDVPPPPALLL